MPCRKATHIPSGCTPGLGLSDSRQFLGCGGPPGHPPSGVGTATTGTATGPPRPAGYARRVSESGLTHVDSSGAARMVDVSGKEVTARRAVATGLVRTTPEVIDLLRRDALPKGDALAVARLAAIMGAKRTPDIVPLCHPIALHGVAVELALGTDTVDITVTTKTADRTGVEMEAMTAVAAAGLALVDMVKAVDPAASIERVRVVRKEGGKTGLWERAGD
jgi:cyclic pyranopterin phosphate synthase